MPDVRCLTSTFFNNFHFIWAARTAALVGPEVPEPQWLAKLVFREREVIHLGAACFSPLIR